MGVVEESWVLSSLSVVVPSIIVCLIFMAFVRTRVPVKVLKENHDVAGFTFSILGVLYSVILGFTVINTQQSYDALSNNIEKEAASLVVLYRDSSFFEKNDRDTIRQHLKEYIDYVINDEWTHSTKNIISLRAQDIIGEVWKSYYHVVLKNDKMEIWYTQSIYQLNEFMSTRLDRLFNSSEHLSKMMWSILLIGGIATIGFMFFFGLENYRIQMIMTAILTGYVSFMLFLVYSLDNALKGPEAIKPTPFLQVKELFQRYDSENQ
jgi:hypothetical protein